MMEFSLFEQIIDKLRLDGVKTVCFVSAQGESLLHPRIFDMLAVALGSWFETNLVTNGTPLNERRIERLAGLGLDAIQFSFAGWDKESYERLYRGARFEQVSRNLAGLIAALKGTRTTLTINGIVDDADSISKTMGYLMSLGAGAHHIRVALPHNWGGTVKAGENQDGIYSHSRIDRSKFKVCPLLLSTPGIYVDGRVTACGCIDANGALAIGDIKTQSLTEMRQGEAYRAMVRAFEAGDVSGLPLCAGCEIPYQ